MKSIVQLLNGKLLGLYLIPIILFLLSPVWSSLFIDKKAIEYAISEKSSINGMVFNKADWPQIKISYDGKDINNGTFITITITNAGSLPIKTDDFESPLIIYSDHSESITAFRAIDKFPENLPVTLSIINEGLKLEPMLMNPGDRFSVEIFGSEDFDILSATARIVGIESIRKKEMDNLSGVYVRKVRQISTNRTVESNLFYLHPITLVSITLLLVIVSFLIILSLKALKTSKALKVIIYAISFSCFALGGFTNVALQFSIRSNLWSIWVTFLINGAIVIIGFLISRYIYNSVLYAQKH